MSRHYNFHKTLPQKMRAIVKIVILAIFYTSQISLLITVMSVLADEDDDDDFFLVLRIRVPKLM